MPSDLSGVVGAFSVMPCCLDDSESIVAFSKSWIRIGGGRRVRSRELYRYVAYVTRITPIRNYSLLTREPCHKKEASLTLGVSEKLNNQTLIQRLINTLILVAKLLVMLSA